MKTNFYCFQIVVIIALASCNSSSSAFLDDIETTLPDLKLQISDSISCQYEKLYDTTFDFKIEFEKILTLNKSVNSNQGLAIWGNEIFAFQDKNQKIDIYNIETRDYLSSINFSHELSDVFPHCNTANFGKLFFTQEDKYPLLYVQDGGLNNKVQVYRAFVNDTISIQKVQTISYLSCYHSATAIDASNNILYVISTIDNKRYILLLDIPPLGQNVVNIDVKNAFKAYNIKIPKVIQDTAFNGQDLFFLCGYKNEGELWKVDIQAKKAIIFDFPKHKLNGEPEGIECYDGDLIISFSNNSVYRIRIH